MVTPGVAWMIGTTTPGILFSTLAEYRTGPTLLKLLRDEEAGRVGITCHFALDVMTYAMGG